MTNHKVRCDKHVKDASLPIKGDTESNPRTDAFIVFKKLLKGFISIAVMHMYTGHQTEL